MKRQHRRSKGVKRGSTVKGAATMRRRSLLTRLGIATGLYLLAGGSLVAGLTYAAGIHRDASMSADLLAQQDRLSREMVIAVILPKEEPAAADAAKRIDALFTALLDGGRIDLTGRGDTRRIEPIAAPGAWRMMDTNRRTFEALQDEIGALGALHPGDPVRRGHRDRLVTRAGELAKGLETVRGQLARTADSSAATVALTTAGVSGVLALLATAMMIATTVRARRSMRELLTLTQAVRTGLADDLAPRQRIAVVTADEPGRLGHAFNQMLDDLETTLGRRRRWEQKIRREAEVLVRANREMKVKLDARPVEAALPPAAVPSDAPDAGAVERVQAERDEWVENARRMREALFAAEAERRRERESMELRCRELTASLETRDGAESEYVQRLESELQSLERARADERARLETRCRELTAQLEQRDDLGSEQVRRLESELEELERARADERARLETRCRELTTQLEQRDDLGSEQVRRLESELEELERGRADERARLETRCRELATQLEQRDGLGKEQVRRLESELEQLEQARGDERARLETRCRELTAQLEQRDDLGSERVRRLESELEELERGRADERARFETRCRELTTQLEQRDGLGKEQVRRLESELEHLERTRADERARLETRCLDLERSIRERDAAVPTHAPMPPWAREALLEAREIVACVSGAESRRYPANLAHETRPLARLDPVPGLAPKRPPIVADGDVTVLGDRADARHGSPRPDARKRVLVCGPDLLQGDHRELLEHLGHDLHSIRDPREAIEAIRSNGADLLVVPGGPIVEQPTLRPLPPLDPEACARRFLGAGPHETTDLLRHLAAQGSRPGLVVAAAPTDDDAVASLVQRLALGRVTASRRSRSPRPSAHR